MIWLTARKLQEFGGRRYTGLIRDLEGRIFQLVRARPRELRRLYPLRKEGAASCDPDEALFGKYSDEDRAGLLSWHHHRRLLMLRDSG